MATTRPSPETTLQVRRIFTAPREKVFAAWTKPEIANKWLCRPTMEHSVKLLDWNPKTGGSYRLEAIKDGNHHPLKGTYREVTPPEKLVFTWTWEDTPGFGETQVTVDFHERGTFTEVVLTHEFFPDATQCERHTQGWNGCFDNLVKALQA
jgi:uncharacterized protein YndB with AHSA1/START domain